MPIRIGFDKLEKKYKIEVGYAGILDHALY